MFDSRRFATVTFALTLVGVIAACGDTGPTELRPEAAGHEISTSHLHMDTSSPREAVTIETAIDFSSRPFRGTFSVTEGSKALRCLGGTFVDRPEAGPPSVILKSFTCTRGGTGTFTARFKPFPGSAPRGWWAITEGTEDFSRLHGSGEFQVELVSLDPPAGEETLTGVIHRSR